MQYVWQHRLWSQQDLRTVDGRRLHIIDQGQLNPNSGPDFFNAKIKIDGEMWVGNVEIHVKASDWHKHNHDNDPAYDNVILHVVDKDDTPIYRSSGELIPQLCMPCSPDFHRDYNSLVNNANSELPCSSEIATLSEIHLSDWISTLAYERLHKKVERINSLLERFAGDWEEVCYITLARSLGFGINSDIFERLALNMPLRFMRKHRDSLLSIEALLLGQSGLLETAPNDSYTNHLKSEYSFLANKFNLKPLESSLWRMARMRPYNFPHRRIALLAQLIHNDFRMMSQIIEAKNESAMRQIFSIELTGFWANHFTWETTATHSSKALSESSITTLLINTAIPLLYAYGVKCDNDELIDRATALLQSLPSEKNSIIDLFSRAGVKSTDAFTSQALIQLRREYCEARKCLYCRIGHRMLSAKTKRQ